MESTRGNHAERLTPGFQVVDLGAEARKKWEAEPVTDDAPPVVQDMTINNLTTNVIAVCSHIHDNPRLQYLITKLIQVSHDFVRDVELNFDEWTAAWEFLTRVGQCSDDVRHEMVLLSDILGISALVDAISHPHKPGSTESSILGPFRDEVGQFVENGAAIIKEGTFGEATLVRGQIRAISGEPVKKALIDIWETDGHGAYDLEYTDQDGANCRGKLYSDDDGRYAFTCIRPVAYPISNDGPVGELLRTLHRHWYRPAHMITMFILTLIPQTALYVLHPEYNKLITALYSRDSKYIESDTVFGVKSSLIVDYEFAKDLQLAKHYGLKTFKRAIDGSEHEGFWLLEFDFTLTEMEDLPSAKVHD
ncbi:hypothetical protein LTR10_015989 [Elasticomyces elasticus]|uniref:Intradiol ring-cleavage dioxygenases domain-containing protein n=1 Tax=Exophiala sideris TaxID=1016849 RepID=A0ABR0J347_9EURO|nr:hypothetical protein LTR10_015989 [Elasticomyces elasticus]KAK5024673.1 hypothetical protein LTS07_008519 [Exophiala sideris]KAK5030766.1 hypothetical protein LTR13_008120 [Exophiala sideris]KAK5054307.1 hypothetical protein LTR69_008922 [Exophiala sideris]KAK5179709.1 hypothetical protein LTR44_007877 [Eurotiomycetes sp. CCFEE 6388]